MPHATVLRMNGHDARETEHTDQPPQQSQDDDAAKERAARITRLATEIAAQDRELLDRLA